MSIYSYGKVFLVQNDHKLLKNIFYKSVVKCPPSVQGFLLRLQKYNFSFEYAPGKTMVVADALSRARLLNCKPETDTLDMTHHMHSIISQLPVREARLAQFQHEKAKDSDLQKLKSYTINGWPSKHFTCPATVLQSSR